MSNNQVPSDLMEALMKDPLKRALLIQLLHQEKDGFEAYKQRELKEKKKQTPVKKLKTLHCESPTALQRRRALEKLNQDTTSESSSSELSEVSAEFKGPKLPFDKLLQGIIAYVEVKKNNTDRSEGIKSVMKVMGATVRDEFTRDVTHVIFKDGSFTTYQKAKLMKVHLVSVLWLEAVRKNSARVPEKNYPAFGSQVCDDENVSILCSQLQKDYEDVIKDEKRRTISASQKMVNKDSKIRRHTMTTPQPSGGSYITPCKSSQSLFSDDDQDVHSTSDDSDCGVIDGESIKRSKERFDILDDSPSITDDLSNTSKSKMSSHNSSLLNSSYRMSKEKRKTVNVISDMVLTPNINSVSKDENRNRLNKILQNSNTGTTTMSSLRVSSGSDRTKSGLASLFSENEEAKSSDDRTKSGLDKDINVANNSISDSGKGDKENCSNATVETTMSSLRLSESCSKSCAFSKPKKNVKSRGRSNSASKKNNRESSVLKDTDSEVNVLEEKGNSTFSLFKSKSNKNTKKNKSVSSSDSDDEFVSNKSSKDDSQGSRQRVTRRSVSMPRPQSVAGKEELCRRSRKTTENDLISRNIEQRSRSLSKTNESRPKSKEKPTKPRTTNKRLSEIEIDKAKDNDSKITMQCKVLLEADVSPAKKSRIEIGTPKKTKKLYNPDDNIIVSSSLEHDKEREEYLKRKTKKSPDEIFLNPNKMHISSLKYNASRKGTLTNSEQSSDDNDEKESQITKNTFKSAGRNSGVDEQTQLLQLLTEKEDHMKQNSIRRSQRISLSQHKPKYRFTSSFSDSQSTNSLPITPIKRRSTLDFQSLTQSQQKRKLKLKKKSSIVCTKMHREEVKNFERVVKNLGTFFVENQVSDKTTHLVAGESKRTINMLRALARGCWILKHEWVLKSQEVGKWLPEEDYEVTEFSPAVLECRLQRQAFGPKYRMDIFKDCGFIYVAKSTTPKQTDLQELIITCQGKVTTSYRNAAIAVGELIRNEGVTCVTEVWILDCITFNKLKPFKNYRIKPERPESDCY